MTNPLKPNLALVLSGGGARGAYEAGVIHYIRTALPDEIRRRGFDILCGSSVGAINTCFVAATSHDLTYQGKRIHDLWSHLSEENIYHRGVGGLASFIGRTLTGVTSNLFRRGPTAKKPRQTHFRGILDTSPFASYLKNVVAWKQITLNIQNGVTKALSVTATNIHTGKMELFIDKHPSMQYSGRHPAHFGPIESWHALASAAIPVLFPSVRVGNNYFCDGGVRLNTPLSPAIQMGADKVLVVGLHTGKDRAEQQPGTAFVDDGSPPTLGEIIGTVMKTFFVDRLDYDLAQLDRINQVINTAEEVYGPDFLHKMNTHFSSHAERKDITARGLKKLKFMSIFPSVDVRKIFAESLDANYLKKHLTPLEKLMLKVLDVDIKNGLDFLTFILFIPRYLRQLLELGFEDARRRHDDLIAFLTD